MAAFDRTKDLKPFFTKTRGNKDYLTVQGRLVWLTQEVEEYSILTERVEHDATPGKEYATFRAVITLVKDGVTRTASAHKTEHKADFGDYGEKAETGSVGRALLLLGYGTASAALDFDEGSRIVDAPVGAASAQTEPDTAAVEEAQRLVRRVTLALQDDPPVANALREKGKTPDTMTPDELSKVVATLEQRARKRQEMAAPPAGPSGDEAGTLDLGRDYMDLYVALKDAHDAGDADGARAARMAVDEAFKSKRVTADGFQQLKAYNGEREAARLTVRTPATART